MMETDRLRTLRMIVPCAQIPSETLEGYWVHGKAEAERSRDACRTVAREYEALGSHLEAEAE